jgi:anti-sigma factor ChrR (cupin superfamily)
MEVAMETTVTQLERDPSAIVQTLSPEDLDFLRWEPVAGCPGVRVRELWRSADMVYALIAYEPGASTPGHPHPSARQLIWVVSGLAVVAGRHLVGGSYVEVPPGVAHPISAPGAFGCTLLQLHHRS